MYHPRFKGTHYEAGVKYGQLMKKNGVDIMQFAKLPQDQLTFGLLCIKEYERYYPEVLQQITGLADGIGIDSKIFAAWLFCMYCYTNDNWCTTMVFKDENTTMMARTSDFATVIRKLTESAYYQLKESLAFIANSTAIVQMEDGVNEYGLAVGLNFILPHKIKPGLNAGFLVRYFLEKCRTVKEVIEEVKKLPIASSQIITAIDQSGDMVAIECNCEEIAFRYPDGNQSFLVSANDFICESMKKYKVKDIADEIHSMERYTTGITALAKNDYSLAFAKKLLSGTYGFMCQYKKGAGFDTIWASIYDIKQKKIYRAEGNPSRTNFKKDNRLDTIWNKQI